MINVIQWYIIYMFKSGLASLLQKQNAREMHPDSVPHGNVKSNCLGLLKKMIGRKHHKRKSSCKHYHESRRRKCYEVNDLEQKVI